MRQIHGVALAALCALQAAPAARAAPLTELGTLGGSGTSHASVAHGMRDLNALLDAASGDTLVEAVAIDDGDQIVFNSANGRVYLLTPVAR